jgi:alpha-beta hydrolase superfamily lysophospholipase
MFRRHAVPLTLLLALALPAAAADPTVDGTTGEGARYGIWMPERWNGELVLYAHGFRNPRCPIGVPTTAASACLVSGVDVGDSGTPSVAVALRDHLLARGYAFAASSYAETGFALKDGAERTHQLRGLFAARYGQPARTYLYGHSMGGAIVVKLAEAHPGHYDGVLASCGMVAGSTAQFRYVADARAIFDALFPGRVPGGIASVPADLDYFRDVVRAVAEIFEDPALVAKAVAWASFREVGFAFETVGDIATGMLELLYFQVHGTPGVLERAHGLPADNADAEYHLDDPSGLLRLFGVDRAALERDVNRTAERVRGDPQALAYARHYYDPRGRLSAPMIALHSTRDAAVPPRLHSSAPDLAAALGAPVVQRELDRLRHCAVDPRDELQAFDDLVRWVEEGERPVGAKP